MKLSLLSIILIIIISCTSKSKAENEGNNSNNNSAVINEESFNHESDYNNTENSNTKTYISKQDTKQDCTFDDGVYSAIVTYNNSETGYTNTYTLPVEVEYCQVVKINFPKGGWLDESHFITAEIDEYGDANVKIDDGSEFDIHIED